MIFKKCFAVVAAALVALGLVGQAGAVSPTDTTVVHYSVTAGTEFSVDITSSTDFDSEPYHLGYSVPNWGFMAYYNYKVTDLRGNKAGWNVKASASNWTDSNAVVVPGATLFTSNESSWNPAGYQVLAIGSITTGVAVHAQDTPSDTIVNSTAKIIWATPDAVPDTDVFSNGSGAFGAKETMWFTFPDSVAVGNYSTTLTLTLASGNAP